MKKVGVVTFASGCILLGAISANVAFTHYTRSDILVSGASSDISYDVSMEDYYVSDIYSLGNDVQLSEQDLTHVATYLLQYVDGKSDETLKLSASAALNRLDRSKSFIDVTSLFPIESNPCVNPVSLQEMVSILKDEMSYRTNNAVLYLDCEKHPDPSVYPIVDSEGVVFYTDAAG